MSAVTTYSFEDVSFVIQHPALGQKIANGEGIGKITVAYTDNLTESDLGADGGVMISKVLSRRGTVTLEIQQTSSVNKWLLNLANTVVNGASSGWASASITITEKFDNGVTTTASQVALIKRPDRSLAQQGDHVSWELFAANISEV
jgi:hypothetical protein